MLKLWYQNMWCKILYFNTLTGKGHSVWPVSEINREYCYHCCSIHSHSLRTFFLLTVSYKKPQFSASSTPAHGSNYLKLNIFFTLVFIFVFVDLQYFVILLENILCKLENTLFIKYGFYII